ncbi:MAG: hypothetical protein ABIR84_12310 [Candidatus Nitrotoga sp.]
MEIQHFDWALSLNNSACKGQPQHIADALDAIHACSNSVLGQITLQPLRATSLAGTPGRSHAFLISTSIQLTICANAYSSSVGGFVVSYFAPFSMGSRIRAVLQHPIGIDKHLAVSGIVITFTSFSGTAFFRNFRVSIYLGIRSI